MEENKPAVGLDDAVNNEVNSAPTDVVEQVSETAPVVETVVPVVQEQPAQEVPAPINPKQALPFDISGLSREQLQAFKQALAQTPDAVHDENVNPTCTLRVINGGIVVAFKTCFATMQMDESQQRKVHVDMIPVLLKGEEEYINVRYKEFLNAETVTCEIIHTRPEKFRTEIGETVSMETGHKVIMYVNSKINWLTLKVEGTGELIEEFDSRLI